MITLAARRRGRGGGGGGGGAGGPGGGAPPRPPPPPRRGGGGGAAPRGGGGGGAGRAARRGLGPGALSLTYLSCLFPVSSLSLSLSYVPTLSSPPPAPSLASAAPLGFGL